MGLFLLLSFLCRFFCLRLPGKAGPLETPGKDKRWFPLTGPCLEGRVHTANQAVNMLFSLQHPLLGAPDISQNLHRT